MKLQQLFRLFVLSLGLSFSLVSSHARAAASDVFEGNGWWWPGARQSGTGFFVEAQGDKAFAAFFMYDDEGKPIWYTASGRLAATGVGKQFEFNGDLQACRGGQSAASNTPSAPTCRSVGGVSIAFSSPTSAVVSLPQRLLFAERFDFNGLGTRVSGNQPETGWYWNAAQNGRGYALEVQNGVMFLTMFHYAPDGQATWNTFSGKVGIDGSFAGDFYSAAGGQTITSGVYRPPTGTTVTPGFAGQFSSPCLGTLTFPGNQTPSRVNRFGFAVSDAEACISPTLDPTSTISFTTQLSGLNEAGARGYAFVTSASERIDYVRSESPRLVLYQLFLKGEPNVTYRYADEPANAFVRSSNFSLGAYVLYNDVQWLAQLNRQGASGFLYKATYRVGLDSSSIYNLYVKSSRRETTYTYRIFQASGGNIDLAGAAKQGSEGFVFRGFIDTLNGTFSLYVKDNTSTATYTYETGPATGMELPTLSELNARGAAFFVYKGTYLSGLRTVHLYERQSTNKVPIQYGMKPAVANESSIELTAVKANALAQRGQLFWGDFGGTGGAELKSLTYKGPNLPSHPLFGVVIPD